MSQRLPPRRVWSRGTFYFHFPTKEHVLVELERAEEVKMVASLETQASRSGI